MIKCGQPEEMNYLPEYFSYYELHDSNGKYGYCGIDISKDMCSLHCHIIRWGKREAIQIKKDFDEIVSNMEKQGIRKFIASYNRENPKKWIKFIKLLGFPEPEIVYMSMLEV